MAIKPLGLADQLRRARMAKTGESAQGRSLPFEEWVLLVSRQQAITECRRRVRWYLTFDPDSPDGPAEPLQSHVPKNRALALLWAEACQLEGQEVYFAIPEAKRGRGRPRKVRDEDGA